ncbi:hypothetical protein CYY_005615 [Polysphondylium violaceum]|uniref:Uncharacterized protein n=1 Tax=Polysphondylium violaceum TaxID=133409 RepID=A0A8J4PSL5_9MYCE|nr:hypothetical protein CYY_005615 [Polysphondylium violaceum]
MVLRQSLSSFSVIKQRLILQQYKSRVSIQTGVRYFSSSSSVKNNKNNNNNKKDIEKKETEEEAASELTFTDLNAEEDYTETDHIEEFNNINNDQIADDLGDDADIDPDLLPKATVVHVPISESEQIKNILKQYDARYTNNPHFYTQLNKTLSADDTETARDVRNVNIVTTPYLETLNEELFGEDKELLNPFVKGTEYEEKDEADDNDYQVQYDNIEDADVELEEGDEDYAPEEYDQNDMVDENDDMVLDAEDEELKQDKIEHINSLLQARTIMEDEYLQKQDAIYADIEKDESARQQIIDTNAQQLKEALADFEDLQPKNAFDDPAFAKQFLQDMGDLYDPLNPNAEITVPDFNPMAKFDHLLNSPTHPLYGTALTRASEESRQYKEKIRLQTQQDREARESRRVYLTKKQTPLSIKYNPEFPPYFDFATEKLLSYDPVLKRYTVDLQDSLRDHAQEEQLFNDIFSKEEQEVLSKHFTRQEITSQLFTIPKDLLNDPLLFEKKFPELANDVDRASEEFNEKISEHISQIDSLEKDIKEIIVSDGVFDVQQTDKLFKQPLDIDSKEIKESDVTDKVVEQFKQEKREKSLKSFNRDLDDRYNQYLSALEENQDDYEEDLIATAEAADFFVKYGKIQDPVPEELNFYGRDAYTKEQLRHYFFELSNRPTPKGKPAKPSNPTAHSLQGPLSRIPIDEESSQQEQEEVEQPIDKKYEKYTKKQTFKLHNDALYTFDPTMMKDYIQYKELAMPYQYTKIAEYMDNVELGIQNEKVNHVDQEREEIDEYFNINAEQIESKEEKREKRERLEKEYKNAGAASGSSSSSSNQQQQEKEQTNQQGEKEKGQEEEEGEEEGEEENRQDDIAYDIEDLDEEHQDIELFLDSESESDDSEDISIDESETDRKDVDYYNSDTDSTFAPTEYDSEYEGDVEEYEDDTDQESEYEGDADQDDSDQEQQDDQDYSSSDKWNGKLKKKLVRGGEIDDSDADTFSNSEPANYNDAYDAFGDESVLSEVKETDEFKIKYDEDPKEENDMFWEIEDPKARLEAIKQFRRRDDMDQLTAGVSAGSDASESSDLTEHVNLEGVQDEDLTVADGDATIYDTKVVNSDEELTLNSDTDTEDLSEIPESMKEELSPGDIKFLNDQAEMTDTLFDDESNDDRTDYEDDGEFLDLDPKFLDNVNQFDAEERTMVHYNTKLYDQWGKEHRQTMSSLTKEQIVEKLQAEYDRDLQDGVVGPNVHSIKYYQKVAKNVLSPEEYQAYKQLRPEDLENDDNDIEDILDALDPSDPSDLVHIKDKSESSVSSKNNKKSKSKSTTSSSDSSTSTKKTKHSEMEFDDEFTDNAPVYNTSAIHHHEVVADDERDLISNYTDSEADNEGNEIKGVDFNFYNDQLNITSARGIVQQENFFEEMELLDIMEGQYEQDFDYLRAEAEMYEKRNMKKLKLLQKRRNIAKEKKKAQMEHLKANPIVRLPYSLPMTQPAKEGVFKTTLAPPNSYVKLNPFTQPEDIKNKKVYDNLINESYRALSSNPYYSVKQTKNSVEKIRKEISAANGNKKYRQHQLKHAKAVADPRLSKTSMLIHPDKLATFMPDYYAVEKEE